MKKLFFLFFLLSLLTTICAQVKLQINKEGVYKIKDTSEWIDAGITSDPEALGYSLKFSEAMAKPGEKILAERRKETLKLKLLFKEKVETRESFIIYNSQTKNIDYIEAVPITKEGSSYLILISIASLILMLISNILFYKKGPNKYATFFTFSAALLALYNPFALIAFSTFSGFFILSAALSALFAFFAFSDALNAVIAEYKASSIIFYIIMVIHTVLLFV